MARLVFEGEGEAWLAGHAVRWDATHVYVEIDDARLGSNGVWLKPADVYRAAPDEPDDDSSGDSMA